MPELTDLDSLVMGPDTITVHEMQLKSGETIEELEEELLGYWNILNGKEKPPYDTGVTTLMEFAQQVYARAMFVQYQILQMERDGTVSKNTPLYKFRTGELRTFVEVAKSSYELGSRRLTKAQMDQAERLDGLG